MPTRLYSELSEDFTWTYLKLIIARWWSKRYTNIYSAEFVAALNKILSHKILPEIMSDINSCSSNSQYTRYSFNVSELENNFEGPSDLAVFMLRFIGFKPKDKLKYNKSIEAKGFLIQSWLYSYSKPKLDKALDLFEFRVLFQYVYYCCIESILKEDSALSKNMEEYSETFKRINNQILSRSLNTLKHSNAKF